MTAAPLASLDKNNAARSSMGYIPALDGVRAVAILGVLIFHAAPGLLRGGFTGVDVFYVLSGYLITSIILHDIRNGRFSMREFYLRRIQRLLPNAALMVLFTVAVSIVVLLPSQGLQVARHGLWTLFNVSNIYIWKYLGGYWGDAATSAPLLHTWSLAVEEQFYLLFPTVLLLLSRRGRAFTVTVAILIASLALCVYETPHHPAMAFYLLPTRGWEPLMGAALAIFMVPAKAELPLRKIRRSRLLELVGWAGLALILSGFLLINDSDRFPGALALMPTTGALALMISIADGETGPARLLARPLPVLIGKLSYSLYLWHWPLIVIARDHAFLNGNSHEERWTLIGAGLGVMLAVIAYLAVEQPLRQRGAGRRQRLRLIAVGFAMCALACVAFSSRTLVADPDHRFNRLVLGGIQYSVGFSDKDETKIRESTRYYDVQFPREKPVPAESWTSGGVIHSWGGGTPRVVVFGSSHALMYGQLIDDICRQHGISVAFLSANASPVYFPTTVNQAFPSSKLAESFDAARRKWLAEWNPDAVLVIDRWDTDVDAKGPVQFSQDLRTLFNVLSPHARKVIVFSQVPVLNVGQDVNLREYVTWYFRRNGRFPEIAPDDSEELRKGTIAAVESVAHEFGNVELLRVDQPFYTNDGSVRYWSGRDFFYADDNHLDDAGAEVVRTACTQAIVAATAH